MEAKTEKITTITISYEELKNILQLKGTIINVDGLYLDEKITIKIKEEDELGKEKNETKN